MTTAFTSRVRQRSLAACLLFVWASLWPASSVQAIDPSTLKLYGHWSSSMASGYQLGTSVALSPKWAVLGAPYAAEHHFAEGALQVYDAVSGNWLRKIPPPVAIAADNINFGFSIAISGDLVVVGVPGYNGSQGAVVVINLTNGTLVRTILAPGGAAGDGLGGSLAVVGDTVIAGARGRDSATGAVYLFRLSTGALLGIIQPAGLATNSSFGRAVAAEGNLLIASAINVANGTVYAYDISTQSPLTSFSAPSGITSFGLSLAMHEGKFAIGCLGAAYVGTVSGGLVKLDPGVTVSNSFGQSVAVNGGNVIVGYPSASSNKGECDVFDAYTGNFLSSYAAPSGTGGFNFGYAVALEGNTLLASAIYDSTTAANMGAGYLIKPLLHTRTFASLTAQQGDFAPGVPDASYGAFTEAFFNDIGQTIFTTKLTGTSSNSGRDTAIVSNVSNSGWNTLFKSRNTYAGAISYATMGQVSINVKDLAFGAVTLSGTGVSSQNNTLLFYRDNTGASSVPVLRTGDEAFSGGPRYLSVVDLAQSASIVKEAAAMINFRIGVASIDAAHDSAIWEWSMANGGNFTQEGTNSASIVGALFGQMAARVCMNNEEIVFSSALTNQGFGTTINAGNNAAVFQKQEGNFDSLVAQKHDLIVDRFGSTVGGVRYATFLGETASSYDDILYRASLSGDTVADGVTTSNNEGLYVLPFGGTRVQVLRKGQLLPIGVNVGAIINYWCCDTSFSHSPQVLALVKLSGTGVNSSNDQALVLVQSDGSLLVLMREGDYAPGCDPAKIGIISRVEVEPAYGTYAILATLTGAPTGTELALFVGSASYGNTSSQATLRRPNLRLRKGQTFSNQPGKVRSISLPVSNLAASGAGCTGRGRAIAAGSMSCIVEYDNGVRQIQQGAVFPYPVPPPP